jgi:1,4-alpha-glucan branching enzyme
MRRLLVLFSLLPFLALSLQSQMVTTDPAVPVMGKLIKIFYDSSKDAGGLHNYTGDLYVHTGVTINGTNWQKVIGAWGDNSAQPKLKYLGNYLYELDITPDIKTYYSISSSEIVSKICLVFRNPAGTLQTKPDIFIEVFQSGLNVTISLPEKSSLIAELSDQIPIKASATNADSVSLYINSRFIKSGKTPDLVTDTITADQYGEFLVKVIAWDKPAFSADSFFFYIRRPVATEALPAGLQDGVNYTGSNSVTLVLHAPYKDYVFVTGDFTDWVVREKGYMKRTPDGERYWLQINNLDSGKEYRFQYFVDNELYIADPYADKVLDPWNDPFITAETYPGLIPYPKDTASGIVSVLQTSQIPYQWKTTNFQPPLKKDLVIYELLIRDFIGKHDFKTLTDTLDYFSRLGINAIELMPVCEFEGNLSWGYNPSFYFAPDKYYGPKNDMKAFVDSCHSRGIAVIMDMVLNHCYGQSPFVQLYLDYYGTDQIYMKTPNPWFNASSPNTDYKFGADFNHESTATQSLVDRINAYWLNEYKIDGFRFDFTKGFTNTPGNGGSYDASRIAILKRMAGKIWSVKPDAYVILEHFAPNTEEKELADYGMMLWGNMNNDYCEAAMGYASNFTNASYLGRGWNEPELVSYMESHDQERLMYKTITWGNATDDYNTRNQKVALKRMQLDALFYFTIPGPKMIWQFGELGYDISIDEGGRLSEKPIKWDYYSDEDRHNLFLMYKFLIGLRNNQPAFSSANYSAMLTDPVKRLQFSDQTIKINILGNFGVTSSTVNPAFQQTGKWYEYFTNDSITVTNPSAVFTFKPGEYRLYTTKKLAPSELTTGIIDRTSEELEDFVTVYPNPSAGNFNFIVRNEIPTSVTMTVFDFTGRIVRSLVIKTPSAGERTLVWDGRSGDGCEVPGGIYFVQVRTSHKVQSVRVLKTN